MSKVILGIDPGRSKTGVALVDASGAIIRLDIIFMANFVAELTQFLQADTPDICIIGDGTTSKAMQATLAERWPQLPLILCNEAHSTEEARSLHWQLNPPQGWRRIIPLGLLTPPEPLDAYAAVVLVNRYLRSQA